MKIEKWLGDARMQRAIFGLNRAQLEELEAVFAQVWAAQERQRRPRRQRAAGGGAKGQLPGPRRKLAFILFYLKVYPTFDVMSAFFDLYRGECCRWVHRLRPALEAALGRKLVLPKRQIRSLAEFAAAFPGVGEVLVDGFERRIARPQKSSTNRKHYSGKKKTHTRKAIVVVDATRRIGLLTRSKRGARHDKRVADTHAVIQSIPPAVSVIADTAFQGSQHPRLHLPRKATKKHPLTPADQAWNRLVSSVRVRVEHAIGGMKRYGAAAGIYRNRKPFCDDHFHLLAAGLWNFHLAHPSL